MDSVPNDGRTPRQILEEDHGDMLVDLFVIIFHDGLKLPSSVIGQLSDDEWSLGIGVYFSTGSERARLINQWKAVILDICQRRLTDKERAEATRWFSRFVPADDAADRPVPAKPRTRRPSPKRLARWEAAWQAEHEAES